MTSIFPAAFVDLEPFAEWSLETEGERYDKRLTSSMDEMQAFYDATLHRTPAAMEYLDQFDLYDMPEQELNLMHLLMGLIVITFPVEAFHQAKVPDTGSTYLLKTVDPAP